ncbi:hypothetical protein RB653_003069 [Dictyostelium firmibasis]|uniref:B box-type domain-containing protein n=1 Tax=Dictyostelium firmibasis TaxID=79012 RepID=A0AAN7YQK5_9MYCE
MKLNISELKCQEHDKLVTIYCCACDNYFCKKCDKEKHSQEDNQEDSLHIRGLVNKDVVIGRDEEDEIEEDEYDNKIQDILKKSSNLKKSNNMVENIEINSPMKADSPYFIKDKNSIQSDIDSKPLAQKIDLDNLIHLHEEDDPFSVGINSNNSNSNNLIDVNELHTPSPSLLSSSSSYIKSPIENQQQQQQAQSSPAPSRSSESNSTTNHKNEKKKLKNSSNSELNRKKFYKKERIIGDSDEEEHILSSTNNKNKNKSIYDYDDDNGNEEDSNSKSEGGVFYSSSSETEKEIENENKIESKNNNNNNNKPIPPNKSLPKTPQLNKKKKVENIVFIKNLDSGLVEQVYEEEDDVIESENDEDDGEEGGVTFKNPYSNRKSKSGKYKSNSCALEEGEEDDSIQSQFDGEEKEALHIVQGIVEGAILFGTNIATGLSGIVAEPIINIVDNQDNKVKGFFKGVGKGLLGAVTSPVKGGSGFLIKTAEGLRNTPATVFHGDHEELMGFSDADQIKEREASHIFEGIAQGTISLSKNLYLGVTGIVTEPIKGLREDENNKAKGFFKGVGKGLMGVIVKPASGIIEMAGKTAEGIANTPHTIINAIEMKIEEKSTNSKSSNTLDSSSSDNEGETYVDSNDN